MVIEINNIKENKDGSATLDISFDKEVETLIKKYYNKKKCTKKLVEKFVIEGLSNYIEREKNKNGK